MKRVILDTDIALDVDDAGALAVLHRLADLGECELAGVIVCSSAKQYDGWWGAAVVSVINKFYGRESIPIGAFKGENLIPDRVSNYSREVAAKFPHPLWCGGHAELGVHLYRRLLAASPNRSVTVLTIGFLNVLEELLNSGPDNFSELDGRSLVAQKVELLSTMGGHFPHGDEEFNFNTYAEATKEVLERWPTPIVFGGGELGSQVKSGKVLNERFDKFKHPVALCWHHYNGGEDRESWDQVQALHAVRGCGSSLELSEPGRCSLTIIPPAHDKDRRKSRNVWTPDPQGNHRYLKLRVPPDELAREIDEIMCAAGVETLV